MPNDAAALLSEPAIAELQSRPGFRAACERAARTSVAQFQALPEPYQWLTKDIGRSAICLTALVLHAAGRLTAQTLVAACVDNQISSPGRANQIIRRCEAIGQMTVEAGGGLWTRRPLRIGDGLIERLKARACLELEALQTIEPAAGEILLAVQTEGGFLEFVRNIAVYTTMRRDLFAFAKNPATEFFLEREAGMLILYDLMGAQAPQRARLLEAAPISRNALSRRYGVSRAHINKMFDQAAREGYLAFEASDRVVFSPTLSAAVERQFTLVFQASLAAGRSLLSDHRVAGAA